MGEALTAISVFAGCGGLDLGAKRAGVNVVWATDCLAEAADALDALIPEAVFDLGDIRDIRAFPKADMVVGGYPCQPFSIGGARNPARDRRADLFREFARAVAVVEPHYFVAENVVGLKSLFAQRWLDEQLKVFSSLGRFGYRVSVDVLDAADFGIPQRRRRLFLVGVRKDQRRVFRFPTPTHCRPGTVADRKPWTSHGDALAAAGLPEWPVGEFYDRPNDPDWGFSWWYMSRNRKALWAAPSRTILANGRQVALHPASCTMRMVWSRLEDGTKQGWEFGGEYEHVSGHPDRLVLERPRRLSWRECAVLQTFPASFEPSGSLSRKYEQIGNAVPPVLAEAVIKPILDGSGLVRVTNLTDAERVRYGLPLRSRTGYP